MILIKGAQASEEPILLWKNYKNTVIFYILHHVSDGIIVSADDAIADIVQDMEDDGVLALFPEDYGLSSEAWTILLLNFKSSDVYDNGYSDSFLVDS